MENIPLSIATLDKPKARTRLARANDAHKTPPRGYGVPKNACIFGELLTYCERFCLCKAQVVCAVMDGFDYFA